VTVLTNDMSVMGEAEMEIAEFDQLVQIQDELSTFFQWLLDENDNDASARIAPTLDKLNSVLCEVDNERMLATPPDPMSGKFIDEFRADVLARGPWLPGRLEQIHSIADLVWAPPSGAEFKVGHYRAEDPAIIVVGYSRYVAFWRIEGEIRYYAARQTPGTDLLSGKNQDALPSQKLRVNTMRLQFYTPSWTRWI
jgi:hypothetical protein